MSGLQFPTLHTTFFGVIAGVTGSATAINVTRKRTPCQQGEDLGAINVSIAGQASRYALGLKQGDLRPSMIISPK